MAGQEQERENLLRDAKSLTEHAELIVANRNENVFFGFRREGSCSVYLGSDPVYHFNSAGELRRAFAKGLLYKADRGRLASLNRRRHDHEIQLQRNDLNHLEIIDFCQQVEQDLAELKKVIKSNQYELVGQVPETVDIIAKFAQWLAQQDGQIEIAELPNVK